jgi:hypothetical protein
MAQRTLPEERDPHSARIIYDMTEWHDRLERLADMRRELPASVPQAAATRQRPQR